VKAQPFFFTGGNLYRVDNDNGTKSLKFFAMKKILCFCLGFLPSVLLYSTTYTVEVSNYQFNPANLNVKVGDVIHYSFIGGTHNAVSSSVPGGAPLIYSGGVSSAIRTYDYTVTLVGKYDYYCQNHEDMVGSFTASNPLPVTLKDFTVTAQANKPVIIWVTSTEQNVNYFSVRSSSDGKLFTEIGKINAKGNSSSEQHYTYTDNNVSKKYRYLYYELVIVDRDGQVTYSPIKTYKTGFASDKLITQLGPNPISRPGQLVLQFNAEKQGKVEVNVYDAGGRKALHTTLTAMPGLNNGHIHVCDFKPGVYTLQFAYEGLVESKQLVVR
jgi:plastocyanin